jgi:hypothetical protein
MRANLAVFLTRSAAPVAAVIIAFGVTFLLSRMLAPWLTPYTYIVLAGIPMAMVWAWRVCSRRNLFFGTPEIVELVDHLSASDGLAATAYERPALAGGARVWENVSGRLSLKPLRLNPAWFGWRLAPAVAFAGAVLFVPPRAPKAPDSTMMLAVTQPLAEKVKIAAEVLPEPEREKLQEQIQQVLAAPEGVSKEKWEAIEDMEQRLENALAQSEASAYQLSSSMNQLAAMVAKQETKAPNVNSAELQTDINSMAAKIGEQLNKNNLAMSEDMKKQLQKALSKCKAGNCKSGELDKLRKQCDALSEKLSKCQGLCVNAGRGGIDRGRADAALVLGDESKLDGAKFDAKQLENQFFEAQDLTDIGITTMEPKPDPGKFAPGTVKDFGSQQGTNVSRTEISPSQRGVVERFFK